jgi:hypothetical protein
MNLRACKIDFLPRGARGKREIGARAVYIAASIQEADIRARNSNACCWCVRHLQQYLLHSWKHMKFSESHYFLLMFLLMLRKKKQQPNSELPLNFTEDPTPDPTSVIRNPKKIQSCRKTFACLSPAASSVSLCADTFCGRLIPLFHRSSVDKFHAECLLPLSPLPLSADHSRKYSKNVSPSSAERNHQECCLLLCADTFYSRFHPSIILQ